MYRPLCQHSSDTECFVSQRRKSVMRILREERNLSRVQAIVWGVKRRSKDYGLLRSIAQTLSIVAIDSLRAVLGATLRLILIYPLSLVARIVRSFKRKKRTLAS